MSPRANFDRHLFRNTRPGVDALDRLPVRQRAGATHYFRLMGEMCVRDRTDGLMCFNQLRDLLGGRRSEWQVFIDRLVTYGALLDLGRDVYWIVDFCKSNLSRAGVARIASREGRRPHLTALPTELRRAIAENPHLGLGIPEDLPNSCLLPLTDQIEKPRGFCGGLKEPSIAEEIEHRVNGEVAAELAPVAGTPIPAKPVPAPKRSAEAKRADIPSLPAGLLAMADALAEPALAAAPSPPARDGRPVTSPPGPDTPRPSSSPKPTVDRRWHPEGPPPNEHEISQALRTVDGPDVTHDHIDSVRQELTRSKVTADELGWALATFKMPKPRVIVRRLAALFSLLRRRRTDLAHAAGVPWGLTLQPDVKNVNFDHLRPQAKDSPGVKMAKLVALALQGGPPTPSPDDSGDAGTALGHGASEIFLEGTRKAAVPWPHGAAPAPATDAPR